MRKITVIVLCMMMIAAPLAALPLAVGGAESPVDVPMFPSGDGSISDPYQISNVTELQWMGNVSNLNKNFTLINDIDASNTSVIGNPSNNGGFGFDPIGDIGTQFTGSLNGQGHSITGLFIDRPATDYVGLFGALGTGASVNNTDLIDGDITGGNYAGGLAGYNAGTITNCTSNGTASGATRVGGITGYNFGGTITDCSSTAYASGTGYVSGFAGYNDGGTITNCYSTGNADGAADAVSGFAGRNDGGGTITNCYSTGNADGGGNYMGGFVGYNGATVTNCYSTGNASGTGMVGGFSGQNFNTITNCYSTGNASGTGGNVGGFTGLDTGTITNCLWDNQTSGRFLSAGPEIGLNTTDMMNYTTFLGAGWSLGNTTGSGAWFMVDGETRPFLQMEYSTKIKNSHQLQLMSMDLAADYELANDIDLSDVIEPAQMWGTSPGLVGGFLPIGHDIDNATANFQGTAFSGSINGHDLSINQLYINRPEGDYQGLFGSIGSLGHANYLSVSGDVTGRTSVGMLSGSKSNFGSVTNCSTHGVVSGDTDSGGLIGSLYGPITDCWSSCDVTGTGLNTGGLIGDCNNLVIRCNATGQVTGGMARTGGLIGYSKAVVSDSFTTGTVSGISTVGGLIGEIMTGDLIESCDVYGDTTGTGDYIGGIVGMTDGNVNNSFNYGEVSQTNAGGSNTGGIIGFNDGGSVTNCTNFGTINSVAITAGGLIGRSEYGWIYNSHNRANITVGANSGGLIGAFLGGKTESCTATGYWANSTGSNLGGFIGVTNWDTEIIDCQTSTDIDGNGIPYGGFIGQLSSGCYINNSHSTGNVTVSSNEAGGFVGYSTGDINNCTSSGSVDANLRIGGFIGVNSGQIWNSHSIMGRVDSSAEITGGFAGRNTPSGSIYNCTSNVTLDAVIYSGGFVGNNEGAVENCQAYSSTNGTTETGGFAGFNQNTGTITNCEAYGYVNGTSNDVAGFAGSNDGTIDDSTSNCVVNSTGINVGGFTGYLSATGTLFNCSVHGNTTGASDYVGGLIGTNDGTATNCTVYGNTNGSGADSDCIGGLVGENWGSITNCTTFGMTSGNDYVGGLIGLNEENGIIEKCYSHGNTTGSGNYVGGLIGDLNDGDVHNSTTYGNTTGLAGYVGGLVGWNKRNVTGCQAAQGTINGTGDYVGGLIGNNAGKVDNSSATCNVIGYGDNVGGLVGYNTGNISYCYADSNVIGNALYTGGLVGRSNTGIGTINRSYSLGTVFGLGNYVGGLVGETRQTNISECFSKADVTLNPLTMYVGGLVGRTLLDVNITNCYAWGSVDGVDDLGGLIGQASSETNVTNCYAIGNVPTVANDGGLVGEVWVGLTTFENCFWDMEASGISDGLGNSASPDVTGQATDVMMMESTFTSANWDFTNIWGIIEHNSYPFLKVIETPPSVSADVGITITDSQDLIMPGDTYNYSVEVTCTGPNNALDVQAVINLPWTVDYVSDNQTATVVDNNITWNIGLLNNGETVWLGIEVTENGTVGTTLLCNGTVTTTTSDPNTANNVTNETTTINRAPNAVNDNYNVDEDSGPNTLVVLANDIDTDDDPFTITAITQGTHGTVTIINASKNVTYTPDADYTGSDTFTYTIDDGNGGTDIGTVTIDVININDAPEITTTDVTTATEDILYSVDYNATDIDPSDTLTWSLVTDAGWLSIVTTTGVLSGTPTNDDVGSFVVSIKVDDGNGGMDWNNFTLIVSNTNDAPVISTTTAPGGTEGQAYSLQVNATDADGDDLTWSLATNATWLSINATGGLIGTPTSGGTFWANVTADDGNGGTDSVNLTMAITGTQTDTDTDGDGVPDAEDDFPNDANETTDTDGDGTGDNADAFPNDATEDTDTDNDGTGDNADAFPTDPAASVDADDDGKPDEWNPGYTEADSTTGLVLDDIVDIDDDEPTNNWLYLILILVVVGVIAGLVVMKGKGKGPAAVEEPEAERSEAPVEESSGEMPEDVIPEPAEPTEGPEPEQVTEPEETVPEPEIVDEPAVDIEEPEINE